LPPILQFRKSPIKRVAKQKRRFFSSDFNVANFVSNARVWLLYQSKRKENRFNHRKLSGSKSTEKYCNSELTMRPKLSYIMRRQKRRFFDFPEYEDN